MVKYSKIPKRGIYNMASVKCPKCQNLISGVQAGQSVKCPKCGYSMKLSGTSAATSSQTSSTSKKKKSSGAPLATWKLVSGILSMILFIIVSLQSCVVGLGNAVFETGESSGGGGILLAILMLTGGIVGVSTRKSDGNGGNIALIILFGLASLIGFGMAGSYTDLNVWAFWCFINAVLAIVAMVKNK